MKYEWPRYKVVTSGTGLAVTDTWTDRNIMGTYGGSKRDRQQRARKQASGSEWRARNRVAHIRRTIVASGEVSRAAADRIARHLDAAGVGRWDGVLRG